MRLRSDRPLVVLVLQALVNDVKVTEYAAGACFGELALIYNAKRAATIIAKSPCTLWSLDLRTFRRMLATASSSQTMARIEFLRRVPLLQNLSNEQISKLAGALSAQSYSDGSYIIRQGDRGDNFYIIKEGTVRCTQTKAGREVELLQLHTVREEEDICQSVIWWRGLVIVVV